MLGRLLAGRKRRALAAVCAGGLSAAVTLWWSAQLSGVIDAVAAGRMPSGEAVIWAGVTVLITAVAGYGKGILSGLACEYMAHDLRLGYARHFALLPAAEAERLNAGEQLSQLQNEIAGVSGYINANLFLLFDDGVRFAATFLWLLFLNPTLTLAANLPAFLVVGYVVWSSRVINAAAGRSQQAKGEMNRHADTLLTLFPIIRLYDAARMVTDGYAGAADSWARRTVRLERTKARLMSLSGLLSNVPLLLLFLVGGRMAADGALSIGALTVFVNLSGNVSGVLMNMPGHIAAFRQFSGNMKRLEGKICL